MAYKLPAHHVASEKLQPIVGESPRENGSLWLPNNHSWPSGFGGKCLASFLCQCPRDYVVLAAGRHSAMMLNEMLL